MLNRQKLVLEQVLDHELPMVSSEHAVLFMDAAVDECQRYLFTQDAYEAFRTATSASLIGLEWALKLPYPCTWIEVGPMAGLLEQYDDVLSVRPAFAHTEYVLLAPYRFNVPADLMQPLQEVWDINAPRLFKAEKEALDLSSSGVLGCVAMLNTRRFATAAPSPAVTPKLAKRRQERGHCALKPYTYVRLSESAASGRTGGAALTARTAHLVGGHFKERSTGRFWWKRHARGKGEVMKRRAYRVTP